MSKSIVVIGGGVIGLCTAYYALQRGHRVTILERGAPDHDSCALGSAGMIVPSHFIPLAAPGMVGLGLRMMWSRESPFSIRPRASWDLAAWALRFVRSANAHHVAQSAPVLRDLALASRACFEELAETHGNPFELVKKGLLILCRTEHGLHEEARTAAIAERLGIAAHVLTASELARLEPGASFAVAGAVHFPTDCHLSPARFLKTLTRHLEESGATFCWSTEVKGWRTEGERLGAVLSKEREFHADEYVIAGGAWSPRLASGLGLNLPIQPGKGYSLTLPDPRELPAIPAILSEARVAVTPLGSSLRFGGTMEIAGQDTSINPRRVRGIIRAATEYFPALRADDFRDLPVWAGLRPVSPDGLPYVGRAGRFTNLSVATGHGMLGLSLGPITGKLIAEIVSGDEPGINLELLNPARFCRGKAAR